MTSSFMDSVGRMTLITFPLGCLSPSMKCCRGWAPIGCSSILPILKSFGVLPVIFTFILPVSSCQGSLSLSWHWCYFCNACQGHDLIMFRRTPTDLERAAFSVSTLLADTYPCLCCQQGWLLLLHVDECLQSSPEQTTVSECHRPSNCLYHKIRTHQSAASWSSLAVGSWTDAILTMCSDITMSPWFSAIIPGQQSLLHCRCRWLSASVLIRRDKFRPRVGQPLATVPSRGHVIISLDHDVLIHVSSWTEDIPFLFELLWTLSITHLPHLSQCINTHSADCVKCKVSL